MQTPYNDPTIGWPHQLFTRRLVQANCTVVYDFQWEEVIGHRYAKFPGLHDLSQTISDFAKKCGKSPLLLLTDKTSVAFNQLVIDSRYIAIVNIHEFLASSKEHPDRSAHFFLCALASVGPETPIEVQQLLKNDVLNELLNKGGSRFILSLLEAALKSFEKSASPEDLQELTNIFSSPTGTVVADAATAAKRRVAVEQFEHLLSENANEHKFQPWFQGNAWVLGSHCVRILDARRIDLNKIADLLVEGYDGRADLIELKRPGVGFWQTEKDRDNYIPHRDLVTAITQAQNYQFALERQIDSIEMRDNLSGTPIAKPSSLLIHGRSHDWNDKQFEAQRLLNAGYTNLNVITYDQVLRRAKIVIGCNAAFAS